MYGDELDEGDEVEASYLYLNVQRTWEQSDRTFEVKYNADNSMETLAPEYVRRWKEPSLEDDSEAEEEDSLEGLGSSHCQVCLISY